MQEVVVVDGVRTPFLKAGSIPNLTATQIALPTVEELFKRYPDLQNSVDIVIGANIGNQILPPDGSNLARIISLHAGIPQEIPAWTVNINCASGLHAVLDAVAQIELGKAECVLVVASEVMSDYCAIYSREQRAMWGALLAASKKKSLIKKLASVLSVKSKIKRMPHEPLWSLKMGLTDPYSGFGMDIIAENLAKEWSISRKEMDLFSLQSQHRAFAGREHLSEEMIPFGKFTYDNGVREGQTISQLAKLRPLHKGGKVTAANSSQVTDGAVSLIVANKDFAKSKGWPAEFKMSSQSSAVSGCNPEKMGLGPVNAIRRLVENTQLPLNAFDLIETNEAFASVVIAQQRALSSKKYCAKLGLPRPVGDLVFENTNVNGGAIAVGHPISASGARLVLTCMKELKRRDKTKGLVTLCVGGGQGEAALIERRNG